MGKSHTEEGQGALLRGWFYLREPVLSKRAWWSESLQIFVKNNRDQGPTKDPLKRPNNLYLKQASRYLLNNGILLSCQGHRTIILLALCLFVRLFLKVWRRKRDVVWQRGSYCNNTEQLFLHCTVDMQHLGILSKCRLRRSRAGPEILTSSGGCLC